ncbi:MAG: hypothetical protein WCB12_02710 [Bryobacteraceae bacterium]
MARNSYLTYRRFRCEFIYKPAWCLLNYVVVSERRKPDRASEDAQDGLARDVATAKVPYFRIYDLRSTYATRLSAGRVADEWVTQLLRQGDAKVFKTYSQMKLQEEAGGAAETEPEGQ